MALTAYLLVPLLELAPPALRVKYFAGNVQKLLSTAETGGDRFMMQENLQLGAKWSAYRSVQHCMSWYMSHGSGDGIHWWLVLCFKGTLMVVTDYLRGFAPDNMTDQQHQVKA